VPDILSDLVIAQLVAEPKNLPPNWRSRLSLRAKPGHREAQLEFTGDAGSIFRLILRQAIPNPLAFSAIIGYLHPGTSQIFRLRRYNGKYHEHSNKLENQRFYDFHIHYATERYQLLGAAEDAFAEPTDRFVDLQAAVNCLAADCLLHSAPTDQLGLFS
jgi:hypothetical protein